jgi:hypothetical protein
MNCYERICNLLTEGKKGPDARRKMPKSYWREQDKKMTRQGASASSETGSPRRSPSLHTKHTDPKTIKARRERAEGARDKRDKRSLAQAAAGHKDAPRWARNLSKRR